MVPKFKLYDDIIEHIKKERYVQYNVVVECEKLDRIFLLLNENQKIQLSYTIELLIRHYNNVTKNTTVSFESIPYSGKKVDNDTLQYSVYSLPVALQQIIFYLTNNLSPS